MAETTPLPKLWCDRLNGRFASPYKWWCIAGPSAIQPSMGVGKSLIFWVRSSCITFVAASEGDRVGRVYDGGAAAVLVHV
eukprot:10358502-Ditylum_brightwellii.AAC.2